MKNAGARIAGRFGDEGEKLGQAGGSSGGLDEDRAPGLEPALSRLTPDRTVRTAEGQTVRRLQTRDLPARHSPARVDVNPKQICRSGGHGLGGAALLDLEDGFPCSVKRVEPARQAAALTERSGAMPPRTKKSMKVDECCRRFLDGGRSLGGFRGRSQRLNVIGLLTLWTKVAVPHDAASMLQHSVYTSEMNEVKRSVRKP